MWGRRPGASGAGWAGTWEVPVSVLGPLLDLFEQGAANGTTVREIVAKGPVELAELFVRNYSESQ